ncbi:substance-K receptor-like [Octopus vulgaris]|uniref:Substance-K receptor-like n=1 Tax=Octopus vulgaris TaxID=6645 RepID=A0AA36AP24_OCTVU|nr:substance-K receptor-like [Octopus vulgaris]
MNQTTGRILPAMTSATLKSEADISPSALLRPFLDSDCDNDCYSNNFSFMVNDSYEYNENYMLKDNISKAVIGHELTNESKIGLIFLYSTTTILAITGNIIVILVFTVGKWSRTDLRPFLINLAIADLVMAIFCMPFTFTYVLLETWIFSKPVCPMVLFVQMVAVTASVSTNMAIGIDRFLAVAFPLRSRLTSARSKCIILPIWIASVMLASVNLFVGRAFDLKVPAKGGGLPNLTITKCEEVWPNATPRRVFTLFVLTITYLLPMLILGVTYSIIGVILWRRTAPGNADRVRDSQQLRSKRKVIKTLVIVVTIFVLCWLPLHVFFLVLDFQPALANMSNQTLTSIYLGVHWLAMSNSFANPIIYGFTNESFRADLVNLCVKIFPCCICLKRLMRRRISMSTYDTGVFRRQSAIHYKARTRTAFTNTTPNGNMRTAFQPHKFHAIDMRMEQIE